MNIYLTVGFNNHVLSCEDKNVLIGEQTEFVSLHNSPFVTGVNCTCSNEVFQSIIDKVGTLEAPVLVESEESEVIENRLNLFVKNGELNVKS